MNYDFIVVGQGIAGSVLADHLIQAGQKTLVIDSSGLSNSSKVAAGLFNPITGRKMLKTWNGDTLFDYLIPYYTELEKRLGDQFFNQVPIYRPFISNEELNEWMGKSVDDEFKDYIKEVCTDSKFGHHIHDSFGGLLLQKSGYLNTSGFLGAFRSYLKSHQSLREEIFNFDLLNLEEGKVEYNGFVAKKIIFSEGQLLKKSPFFNWLPLRPVKGEILFIRVAEEFDVIYNRGVFVVPIGGGVCKVGSTYNHENLDNFATDSAKRELCKKLEQLLKLPFEIIDQKAGVRPATIDRKPFIGFHPEKKQLGVFNGFGAKGVSLVPFYANQFARHMTDGLSLDDEVNIRRFFSLYSNPFN